MTGKKDPLEGKKKERYHLEVLHESLYREHMLPDNTGGNDVKLESAPRRVKREGEGGKSKQEEQRDRPIGLCRHSILNRYPREEKLRVFCAKGKELVGNKSSVPDREEPRMVIGNWVTLERPRALKKRMGGFSFTKGEGIKGKSEDLWMS